MKKIFSIHRQSMNTHLFDNVFIAITNVGSLYDGYTEIGKKKLNVTIVKDEYLGYCKYCESQINYKSIGEYIMNRITCKITDDFHYVVYEKFEFNLATFVDSAEYDETSAISIMKDLIRAVQSMHNKEKFHLNINPDVIMVYKSGFEYRVKFLDFFMSREGSKIPVAPNENIIFSAPELIKFRKNYEKLFENPTAADIFSLGVCLFFACTRSNPFERAGLELEENITNENYKIDYRIIGIVNLIAEYKKFFLKDVVISMLKYEPNKRSSLKIVLENPLFWEKHQVSQFFKKNNFKIIEPKRFLPGSYFNEGRYKNLKIRIESELDDMKLTTMLLKYFPTLLYDLWINESS